jgi:hypothetical protein
MALTISGKSISRLLFLALILCACAHDSFPQVKQPKEVIEAYGVCNKFQTMLREDLDFSRAFEATFAKDSKRRREIAIREGEFDSADVSNVDSATLISAYKSRMQLFYLMLPLASPDDSAQEELFFPPAIKEVFKRKFSPTTQEFASYAAQLESDVAVFRAHLDQLATHHLSVAERIRRFKSEILGGKLEPPKGRIVRPLRGAAGGRPVRDNEPYYQFDGYTVVREERHMRIVSIRFFTRLF